MAVPGGRCYRRRQQQPMGGNMRALRWVVTCTVLLAGATAYGAEPVKIRASWIVAPSDWTPLLLEKPELMTHNGKSYAFEPMRFQGTPAVITALQRARTR
jgi:NitT/TauT family transport system substrate-binding protein